MGQKLSEIVILKLLLMTISVNMIIQTHEYAV